MTTITTPSSLALVPSLKTAWQDVDSSRRHVRRISPLGALRRLEQQNRVIADIDRVIAGGGVFKKPTNLLHTRRPRNMLKRVETGQFNTRREIGSAPSLRCGITKEAAQTTAERVQGPAAPSTLSLSPQKCVDVGKGHRIKRSHLRRQ